VTTTNLRKLRGPHGSYQNVLALDARIVSWSYSVLQYADGIGIVLILITMDTELGQTLGLKIISRGS
jgi:hypothetical protein